MGMPAVKIHEANFDYLLRKSLDELIEKNLLYHGLKVELQPTATSMGRPDLIIRDGLKPLIIFETKKHQQDVDSLTVHRKAREYAMTMRAEYFVVSNVYKTYFFKNAMGPLRELQIQNWKSATPLNIKLVLEDILAKSLSKVDKGSRKDSFLSHYERIYQQVVVAYNHILNLDSTVLKVKEKTEKVRNLLNRAEKEILNYMGTDLNMSDIKKRADSIQNLATQGAYLLLNKIFCYQVISAQFSKQFNIQLEKLYNKGIIIPLQDQLDRAFSNLILRYDFAPIFHKDAFFSEIPFSNNLNVLALEFLEELSEFDLENLEEDFIGEMYQRLIPLHKKKALGQIYTPVDIAKLMVDLTITKANAIVLDPACGCGTFLKEIYQKLSSLNHKKTVSSNSMMHAQLLEQIWGVEINSFPSHLSMMNLTFMNLSSFSDLVGVLVHDFLDMGPMEKYNVKTKNLRTNETISREMPHKFDVIIANPPYVKQEKIPNKKKMIKKLSEFAQYRSLPSSQYQKIIDQIESNPKQKGQLKLPKVKLELKGQTDYYGYFLWYSTYFLKNHGDLCFIIPNKWMDVKYGIEIKQFLKKNYRIRMVLGFEKNVFPDAQVSTIILLLQKEKNKVKRDENYVRFMALSSQKDTHHLKSFINTPLDPTLEREILVNEYIFANFSENLKCTYAIQSSLDPEKKWSFKYLYQSEFLRLLSKSSTIKLDNPHVSRVIPGLKSSANNFFFPSPEDILAYNIPMKFLKPGIKSGRQIPSPLILDSPQLYFLSIPSTMQPSQNPELYSFIDDGKNKHKYNSRPSIKWKPWYSIPEEKHDSPDILFLRHIDKDFVAHWNQIGSVVADGVRGITLRDKQHTLFYLGVLNSTFFYWQAHIKGRWEGQGDLQLLVYELKTFDIPDISLIDASKRKAVEVAMNQIIKEEQEIIDSKKYQLLSEKKRGKLLQRDISSRKELDLAVLDCLDLKDKYDVLIAETSLFESLRLEKSV